MRSTRPPWSRWHAPFATWLFHNPTGIPPRSAALRAVAGMVLGGSISYLLIHRRSTVLAPVSTSTFVASVIGGSVVSPLAVTYVSYHLDRLSARRDTLLGYSGIMRELFHAGELVVLGAVGGGLGAGQRNGIKGFAIGALSTSAIGGIIYTLRGFGPAVGITAGLISGAIAGALAMLMRGVLPNGWTRDATP